MDAIQERYRAQITEIVEACHRAGELGYVTSSGGNLSYRVAEDVVLITPTKTPKRTMRFEDICAVDAQGRTLFAPEGKKPTGETPFHVRILQNRPDLRAIVHAHPPLLTGFAIAGDNALEMPFLPEPIIEVGPMVLVPYAEPLSEELAQMFDARVKDSNGFLMENHGAVMCSPNSVFEALEMLQMMECMAQSILVARQLGNARIIPRADVRNIDRTVATRELPIPGAPGRYASVVDMYTFEEGAK